MDAQEMAEATSKSKKETEETPKDKKSEIEDSSESHSKN